MLHFLGWSCNSLTIHKTSPLQPISLALCKFLINNSLINSFVTLYFFLQKLWTIRNWHTIDILREKSFWKTLFQVRARPVKGTETRQEWENSIHVANTTLYTTKWCRPAFWPPTQCTFIPIASSLSCVQNELGMQLHCVGGQREQDVIIP